MKNIFILTIILTAALNIFAQKKSIKPIELNEKDAKLYQEAIKDRRLGKIKDANNKLDKLIKKLPTFYEAKLRKAAWLYELNNYKEAAIFFEEVIKGDAAYDIEMYNSAATNAVALKDYAKAAQYYQLYLEKAKLDEERYKDILTKYETALFRSNALKNPNAIKKEKLKGSINTDASEFLPFVTLDGRQMVFTRRAGGHDELYISRSDSSKVWNSGSPIFPIADDRNKASASFSDDGLVIAFTMCNLEKESYGSCDIFFTDYEDNKWSKPYNAGNIINTGAWESQPCLIDNGRAMIFSSSRKGSLGGNDLWITQRGKNNKWSIPENLGKTINTSGNEESPFLHPDGKTLFFRSTGHIGMGNYDLFYSKYDPIKKAWSEPVNLGYPINTEGQEGALFVERDGITAYYVSDTDLNGKLQKHLDIFSFNLPAHFAPEPTGYIKLKVVDVNNKPVENVNYTIINLFSKDTILHGKTLDNYITLALPKNKNYALYLDKQGCYPHSENFNTAEEDNIGRAIEKIVTITKIELIPEKPIVLRNIFFDSGKSVLLQDSYIEIEKLSDFLQKNNKIKIKIIGHTDDVGNDIENKQLSEARAKAVYDALISKGIASSRLSYEGKGESQPIADNQTAEGRRQNRRTEFVVLNL